MYLKTVYLIKALNCKQLDTHQNCLVGFTTNFKHISNSQLLCVIYYGLMYFYK